MPEQRPRSSLASSKKELEYGTPTKGQARQQVPAIPRVHQVATKGSQYTISRQESEEYILSKGAVVRSGRSARPRLFPDTHPLVARMETSNNTKQASIRKPSGNTWAPSIAPIKYIAPKATLKRHTLLNEQSWKANNEKKRKKGTKKIRGRTYKWDNTKFRAKSFFARRERKPTWCGMPEALPSARDRFRFAQTMFILEERQQDQDQWKAVYGIVYLSLCHRNG